MLKFLFTHCHHTVTTGFLFARHNWCVLACRCIYTWHDKSCTYYVDNPTFLTCEDSMVDSDQRLASHPTFCYWFHYHVHVKLNSAPRNTKKAWYPRYNKASITEIGVNLPWSILKLTSLREQVPRCFSYLRKWIIKKCTNVKMLKTCQPIVITCYMLYFTLQYPIWRMTYNGWWSRLNSKVFKVYMYVCESSWRDEGLGQSSVVYGWARRQNVWYRGTDAAKRLAKEFPFRDNVSQ